MARWNYSPKFKIVKFDAYSILEKNPSTATSKLKKINEYDNSFNPELSIKSLTYHFEQIAASFTPVKNMSPVTKDKLYGVYKYYVFPIKIYMMQLNNKRVEVKL